ncbi:hypothetical protein F5I97DRAFT_2076358 [Phlebopus sp. FC_14]|nr:hypothetical protein F5I97DRAFT_2076358 [Phlebopus sp. FC_14]
MGMESWDKGLGKGTSCNFLIHSGLEFGLTVLQAKFHRVKRDVIDDVRQVFPHGQILVSQRARAPDVTSAFDTYVNNELPTYLIYVPEKRLVIKKRGEKAISTGNHRSYRGGNSGFDNGSGGTLRSLIGGSKEANPRSMLSFRPAGYDKLVKFCDKADEYGCRLAWSDTCCINKDSSTELEEAIRSMFKWYRDSQVCIAYLADSTPIDDLGRDVWFTRGWTLQELLALRTMKFYGRRQTERGEDECSMMWASTRTTTRIEDIAYCLIGIFDVSMTIAYGEGKRAFYRLMEAIIHRCGEWQIMAWAGQPSADSAALPESPRCFRQLASHPDSSTGSGECEQKAWRGDRNYVRRVAAQSYPRQHSLEICTLYEGAGDGRKECTRYGQCTVGVDYWCYDTSGQGVLKPSQDHLCLLLRMDPFDPFAEWQKVQTADLLTVSTDVEVKEALTTVWL